MATAPAVSEWERPLRRAPSLLLIAALWFATPATAQQTVGQTGFAAKRPVLASACPNGCPWGELGDFVKEAMEPLGYEVLLCRNCNRDQGPPLVSAAALPPQLTVADAFTGTTTRVDAPVDFGITSTGILLSGYLGKAGFPKAYTNLRMIAKIEDPMYLLVAVKTNSGITDLAQVAKMRKAVSILGGGSGLSQRILDHFGLTQDAVTSWGGSFTDPIVAGATGLDVDFDIIINELASPANNPESAIWTNVSQKYMLRFLDLPDALLDELASDKTLDVERVTAKWGLLRGVDRAIKTVAHSGHAVFARDDTPEQGAYDAAQAIDAHRSALKWYIRPYSYDSHTVWQTAEVPLHPGAERYYRKMGYMPGSASPTAEPAPNPMDPGANANAGTAGVACMSCPPGRWGQNCQCTDPTCGATSNEAGTGGTGLAGATTMPSAGMSAPTPSAGTASRNAASASVTPPAAGFAPIAGAGGPSKSSRGCAIVPGATATTQGALSPFALAVLTLCRRRRPRPVCHLHAGALPSHRTSWATGFRRLLINPKLDGLRSSRS